MNAEETLRQHISKIVTLTDGQFSDLFSHFRQETFSKGQVVIGEGDKVDKEYFVIHGCMKAFSVNEDAKVHILQFAMTGWWISDFDALYNHTKATIAVDCITDAEVLSITNDDREKVCRDLHPVEHFFRWRTNKGYVAAQKRVLSLMNSDAKTRFEELIKTYPALYNAVPKHLIAAYLGVSRETLSRLYQSHK